MVKKVLGYVLAILGVVGIAAWAVPEVKTALPMLDQISDTILIAFSAVLAILGIFLIVKGGGGRRKGGKEVPIYQGKNVVGYRRH